MCKEWLNIKIVMYTSILNVIHSKWTLMNLLEKKKLLYRVTSLVENICWNFSKVTGLSQHMEYATFSNWTIRSFDFSFLLK